MQISTWNLSNVILVPVILRYRHITIRMCVCACVSACVRACMRACACACVCVFMSELECRNDDLEHNSRLNSLVFHGLPETEKNTKRAIM